MTAQSATLMEQAIARAQAEAVGHYQADPSTPRPNARPGSAWAAWYLQQWHELQAQEESTP